MNEWNEKAFDCVSAPNRGNEEEEKHEGTCNRVMRILHEILADCSEVWVSDAASVGGDHHGSWRVRPSGHVNYVGERPPRLPASPRTLYAGSSSSSSGPPVFDSGFGRPSFVRRRAVVELNPVRPSRCS